MAVNGMRGSDSYSGNQRPGSFSGGIKLTPNTGRVSREDAAAKVAASKPKGKKGKMPRVKK